MERVFIGVGANLDPERHVREALERLSRRVRLLAVSSFYRTPPEDRPGQPDFVNGVVEIQTLEPPGAVRALLQGIEAELGRRRTADKSAPRPIDLDLLLYGERVMETQELTLPDRDIGRRAFLALPLAELAPGLHLPGTRHTLREVARPLAGRPMTLLPALTEELRRKWPHRGSSPSFTAVNKEKVQRIVRELLVELGEDPHREGLLRTPQRVAAALEYLTSGYRVDVDELINHAIFSQETNNMVVARDIELYSLCEEHLMPFFGRCHIGYTADRKVFGLSKLARLADMYARRLQQQERMTDQIARVVHDSIGALGVGVVIEARHLCLMMRGVEKQGSVVVTSSMLGSFRESPTTRAEFLSLVGRPRP
ncbi:MAG: GTP cyclohydrolase I FolE [Myxococcaceae bacterium]